MKTYIEKSLEYFKDNKSLKNIELTEAKKIIQDLFEISKEGIVDEIYEGLMDIDIIREKTDNVIQTHLDLQENKNEEEKEELLKIATCEHKYKFRTGELIGGDYYCPDCKTQVK